MHLPDYHGGSIVNLMTSLQKGLEGPDHPYTPSALLSAAKVAAYRQVVLWVIDGLGFNYLRAHPDSIPVLHDATCDIDVL